MKYLFPKFGHPGLGPRRTGFALVVALTAIVLITVIVLAFFSKALLNRQVSFTSTNQIKSDMLARTALDIVVGEVRQEIVDFSSVSNGIFQPVPTTNVLPAKVGVNGADTNAGAYTISKVSAANTPVNPGNNGKAFGSSVTLDSKSRNGRSLSQWFGTGPNLGSAALPTWSYLSREGQVVTNFAISDRDPLATNFVSGRFSYTVYNVGGLLDANVTGYPASVAATNAAAKSSIAYANLGALGWTSAQIDALVAWRNRTTSSDATTFNIWASGVNTTNTAASRSAAAAAAGGYLEVASGDNAFFSRRDLLRFLTSQGTTNAAAYLTHFSRAIMAPSWGPRNVPGSVIDYADQASDSDEINRLLPEVGAFNGVITDYADDGTPSTRKVYSSEALVQKKFSLAKLAWIGHDGPNAGAFSPTLTAAERALAIKTCFGLTWVPNSDSANTSSDAHWEYDHGNANDILILDEVRQAQRAPDFFELLKAGILHGSLGTQPGIVAEDISVTKNALNQPISDSPDWKGPIGRDFEAYSSDEDRHVLQIGANIIDQADKDNYPTAIHMDLINKYSGSERLFFNTVFGLENLPMLQRMGVINSRPDTHGTDTPGMMNVWMQPELWNPNEKSTVGTSPADTSYPTPSSLRLVTYGKSYVWNTKEDPDPTDNIPVDFGTAFYKPMIDGIMCFKNPLPTSTTPVNFFDAPRVVTGYERASNAKKYEDTTSVSGPRNRYPAGATWVGTGNANNQFIGVFVGECAFDPSVTSYEFRTMIDGYLTFVVEYFDGSSWRPYCSLARLETLHSNGGSSSSVEGTPFILSIDGHVDPRTSRFSGSAGRTGTGANTGWGGGLTVRSGPSTSLLVGANGRGTVTQGMPRAAAGLDSLPVTKVTFTHNPSLVESALRYLFDEWAINLDAATSDKPVSLFRYADPDGVTRPGDSWQGNYDTGDGVVTYHATILPDSAQRRRSIILNRPFRSVGELGYVFRDLPFKTLDLWSANSPDAALLDLFAISDKAVPAVAGKINPNVAPPKVLEALFSGAGNQAATNSVLSPTMVSALVQGVSTTLSSSGPLLNPSELVHKLSAPMYAALTNSATNTAYQNKSYGESPLRALSGNTSTRTWNLLLDVVAQSGKLAASSADLSDFIVEGEKRYWLHLAVDRYTGEIVDRQLEPVYE